jgi:hypothetical protein
VVVGDGAGDVVVGSGVGDVVVGDGAGDVVVGSGVGDVVVGDGAGDVVVGDGAGDVVVGDGFGLGLCVYETTRRGPRSPDSDAWKLTTSVVVAADTANAYIPLWVIAWRRSSVTDVVFQPTATVSMSEPTAGALRPFNVASCQSVRATRRTVIAVRGMWCRSRQRCSRAVTESTSLGSPLTSNLRKITFLAPRWWVVTNLPQPPGAILGAPYMAYESPYAANDSDPSVAYAELLAVSATIGLATRPRATAAATGGRRN